MNNIKLAIIDVDGLFYHSATDTMELSIQKFQEKFQNVLTETKVTHYVGFYSNGRYFRHEIYPDYKFNRRKSVPPKYLKALKQWAIAEYNFQFMDKVEADDLCAYWMNEKAMYYTNDMGTHIQKAICPESTYLFNLELYKTNSKSFKDRTEWKTVEKILCTPDKDLLQSISGKHFNYSYKVTDEAYAAKKEAKVSGNIYTCTDDDVVKGWWVETNKETSIFRWKQMIIGDASDGIKGVEGKGEKYWEKLINKPVTNFPDDILAEYVYTYGLSQGIFEFQKNYRLLHLLTDSKDFMREVGELPNFPTITEIENYSQIYESSNKF